MQSPEPAPHRAPALQVSFEFFPPASAGAEATLWATLTRLETLAPRFVSVTYGADGSSRARTVEVVRRMRGLIRPTVVPHVTGVALCRARLSELARQYWTQGIRKLVRAARRCAGGGSRRDIRTMQMRPELVADLKRIADFQISVAAYPEVHPEAKCAAADIVHLKRKVDAGATQAITQFFYDNNIFFRFRDTCAKAGISMPIVPGILPLANLAQVSRFASRCGSTIPASLRARVAGLQEDPRLAQMVAAAVMYEQIEALRREGVECVHFYTPQQGRGGPSRVSCAGGRAGAGARVWLGGRAKAWQQGARMKNNAEHWEELKISNVFIRGGSLAQDFVWRGFLGIKGGIIFLDNL